MARRRRRASANRAVFTKEELRVFTKRLWDRIDVRGPDECWPWIGKSVTKGGYGRFRLGSTNKDPRVGAHRMVFFITYERWPEPQCRHTCDNPPCCNPAHLVEGTSLENQRDMVERGRSLVQVGELNHAAKLTEKEVAEIRAKYAQGGKKTNGFHENRTITQGQLAREYGVSIGIVCRIINGSSWGHSLVKEASHG